MLTHQHSLELLKWVHPDLAKVIFDSYDSAASLGLPYIVVQGVRTQAQQDALYAQGRTTPGNIVTWTRESNHLTGHAVDLCIVLNGKAVWNNVDKYIRLSKVILDTAKKLNIPIVWGGTFVSTRTGLPLPDYGHIELDRRVYG